MKTQYSRSRIFFVLLCCIQPFLDAASYWINVTGGSNELTLAIRFGLLILCIFWGFRHTGRRWLYLSGLGFVLCYLALHCFACWQAGYADPLSDLTNQVRILVLPGTALCCMTFLQQDPEGAPLLRRALFVNFMVIFAIEVIATVTGTDPHTYVGKGIGVCGWFYDTSSQSAILCTLVPIALGYFLEKRPGVISALAGGLIGLGVLYLYATRLSYLALAATGFILGTGYIFTDAKTRKQGLVLLCITVFFLALYPISPMVKNQQLMAGNYDKRQEWIDSQLALSEGEEELDRLAPIYEEYLPGLVEHFGLERTAAAYDYRTDCRIAETRPAKLAYSRLLLEDSPPSAKLFGMELSRWVTSAGIYDVENDLPGMLFLCGWLGLGAMLAFLLFYVAQVAVTLVRSPKAVLNMEMISLGTAALMSAAHIYATSGVLRRPNAGFYLALCLALIWNRTQQLKTR